MADAPERVVLRETNAISGPITVPGRLPLGDSGIMIHPLALGGDTFEQALATERAEAMLDRFVALGGSFIGPALGVGPGTAPSSSPGRGLELIGRWMASRRVRDRVVLSALAGAPSGVATGEGALSPQQVCASVEAARTALGAEVIDVLYLRGDDPATPFEETLGAVGALIDAGTVRAVGACDVSPERLIEARVLAANGLPRIQLLTTRYDLMERTRYEGALELVAHAQRLAVLPYGELASGLLEGGEDVAGGSRAGVARLRSETRHGLPGVRLIAHLGRRVHRVLAAIDEIAFARDLRPAIVALAWLRSRPTVAAPVVEVGSAEHVDALLAAASVELSRSELVELDRASG